MPEELVIWAIGIGILILVFVVIIAKFFRIWLEAYMANTGISIFDLMGMSLRRVDMKVIVRAKVMCVQTGLPLETKELEAHYLAGGDVLKVVAALVAARQEGVDLDFRRAKEIDLSGEDVLEFVQASASESKGV